MLVSECQPSSVTCWYFLLGEGLYLLLLATAGGEPGWRENAGKQSRWEGSGGEGGSGGERENSDDATSASES